MFHTDYIIWEYLYFIWISLFESRHFTLYIYLLMSLRQRYTWSFMFKFTETETTVSISCLEIDRYIGLPIFFPIFKHFTIIGYRFKKKNVFVTYTIIQSITSSEMCSLDLTHPSAHTLGAVGTVHSGEAPARPPHVTLYKIYLFKTR